MTTQNSELSSSTGSSSRRNSWRTLRMRKLRSWRRRWQKQPTYCYTGWPWPSWHPFQAYQTIDKSSSISRSHKVLSRRCWYKMNFCSVSIILTWSLSSSWLKLYRYCKGHLTWTWMAQMSLSLKWYAISARKWRRRSSLPTKSLLISSLGSKTSQETTFRLFEACYTTWVRSCPTFHLTFNELGSTLRPPWLTVPWRQVSG